MKGGLKPQYSALIPFLTAQNKYFQLLYALEMVTPNDTTKFQEYNFIHVDEKWLYLMRDRQHFLLADEEIPPQHCVCHKGHITKVMFLHTVVHPCYNTSTKTWWDGKLGIWPIGVWEVAKQQLQHHVCFGLEEQKYNA